MHKLRLSSRAPKAPYSTQTSPSTFDSGENPKRREQDKMMLFEDNEAFKAFEEKLAWEQDGAPHLRGSFSGSVLKAAPSSRSAGHTLGAETADSYTILVDFRTGLLRHVSVGDTIRRTDGTRLTIKEITREHGIGAYLKCTAEERVTP